VERYHANQDKMELNKISTGEVPILIYSHSSYSDVWPLIFGQFEKYFSNSKIYLLTDEDPIQIKYPKIYYKNEQTYNERVIHCIMQLDIETFLFTHEDMPLYNIPNYFKLNQYIKYIENGKIDSVKLIFGGWHFKSKICSFDESLSKNKLTRFSIQPTIIKKRTLISILSRYSASNLWKLERKISKSWYHPYEEFACNLKGEKHGNHCDCSIYPYIATAIVKGKWNFEQYDILKPMLDEYQIRSRNYD